MRFIHELQMLHSDHHYHDCRDDLSKNMHILYYEYISYFLLILMGIWLLKKLLNHDTLLFISPI